MEFNLYMASIDEKDSSKSGEKQLATPAGITVASYPDCWWPWEGWRREPGIHSLCTHLNSWGIRS